MAFHQGTQGGATWRQEYVIPSQGMSLIISMSSATRSSSASRHPLSSSRLKSSNLMRSEPTILGPNALLGAIAESEHGGTTTNTPLGSVLCGRAQTFKHEQVIRTMCIF